MLLGFFSATSFESNVSAFFAPAVLESTAFVVLSDISILGWKTQMKASMGLYLSSLNDFGILNFQS
jgi:hypothetical protein